MKALIIAFANFDNNVSYIRHLRKSGIEPTALFITGYNTINEGTFTRNIENAPFGFYTKMEDIRMFLPEKHILFLKNNASIWFAKTPHKSSYKKGLIKNFKFMKTIARKVKVAKFDVIHFNGTGVFCLMLSYLLNSSPKVWTLHDYKAHTGEGRLMTVILNKILITRFDAFIQHYDYLKRSFASHFGINTMKVFRIYQGSLDIFKSYEKETQTINEPYFLWFGRISKYKGLEELIDAYNELVKKPNLRPPNLIIAGAGPLWFDAEKISSNPKIIFIHKRICVSKLISLVKSAYFITVPYKDATHSAVVALSFTFNKPCLVTDVGGLSEVVKHGRTGYVIDSVDSSSIMKGLIQLIEKPDVVYDMQIAIQEELKTGQLSWLEISKNYKKTYDYAIRSKKLSRI